MVLAKQRRVAVLERAKLAPQDDVVNDSVPVGARMAPEDGCSDESVTVGASMDF
jgi:hypothetical protein